MPNTCQDGAKGQAMADILVPRQNAAAGDAAALVKPSPTAWAWPLAIAGMVLVLLAPALWNGFPLVFSDTGGYLTRPIDGTLAMGRSALYGWFLYISVPLAFWPVLIAQAAACAWLIALTLRCHGLGGRPWLAFTLTAALAVTTSLPWFAAQLMPDVLFSAGVLALYLLMFRGARLKTAEKLGLVALVALAIACHMAALGLCIGVFAALWLATRVKYFALPSSQLSQAGTAVGAGIALALLSNLAITGSFAFTPGGASFLFGRLIEDGIAARYLSERCPDRRLRICGYYHDLPDNSDDFLWANDAVFWKLGGPRGFGPEAMRIAVDSLHRYPLMHAQTAATAALAQFVSFRTEISIHDNDPTYDAIRDHAPSLLPAFMQSRQEAQPFDIAPLNLVHVPVGALSIAGLVAALVWRRRLKLPPEAAALCLTVLLALAVNAAICGVFSHPVDRYQSRLVPLAPFALAVAFATRRKPSTP